MCDSVRQHSLSLLGRLAVLAPLMLVPASGAMAEPPPKDRLKAIESEIRDTKAREAELAARARRLSEERAALERKVAGTARALREQERKASEIEARLAALSAEEAAAEAELDDRREAMARTLTGLVHTARLPQGIAALGAGSPVDTHRAALLMGGATAELDIDARRLRAAVEKVALARDSTARQREALAGTLASLNRQRGELSAALADREKADRETQAARKAETDRLRALAADARDVRQLIQKLEAEESRRLQEAGEAAARANRPKPGPERQPEPPPRQTAALPPPAISAPPPVEDRGAAAILLPARGQVVARFGDPQDAGQTLKGVRVMTGPGSVVYAPADGKVIFAGPFRGYGPLLILSYRDGYHLLIAGFGRIEASAGQSVARGDPIGFMSEEPGAEPLLYVELRRKGEPVNPLPWLAQAERKVNG